MRTLYLWTTDGNRLTDREQVIGTRQRPQAGPRGCYDPRRPRMQNFYEQFARITARFPDRLAVEVQRRDRVDGFTYATLDAMAARTAAWLARSAIVARGDRCAILAENDAHWCAAYLGVLRLGAVAVPLDTAYKAAQVATLLNDSGARVIFTSRAVPRDSARRGASCRGAPM